MKTFLLYITFLCLTLLLDAQVIDEVYDFPIKPGTEEWGKLKTENERFAALQIPEDLLKNISTDNLIISCINFPLFGHYGLFDNKSEGIDYLINRFNGLQELLNRPDSPAKLLELYLQMDTSFIYNINKNIDKMFPSIRKRYFEFILTKDLFINKMNDEERLNLMNHARQTIYKKINSKKEYSIFEIQPALLIIGKVIDKSESSNFYKTKNDNIAMEEFIKTGKIKDNKIIADVISSSESYLNSSGTVYLVTTSNNVPDFEEDLYHDDVRTPNGTLVQFNYLVGNDLDLNDEDQTYLNYYATYYPNAQLEEDPTWSYNCHGFAWHLYDIEIEQQEGDRPTGTYDRVWINYPSTYWTEENPSYISCSYSDPDVKIVYYDGTYKHSAVLDPNDHNWVTSKWAQYGRYKHELNDHPFSCPPSLRKYYKRNCADTRVTGNINTDTPVSGCDVVLTNVKVQNDAKLTIDAENDVNINCTFEVVTGSELEIK